MSNPTASSYVVQAGDTLYAIAVRVYGDGEKFPLIQQANNLANPNLIEVGQTLLIPALDKPADDLATIAQIMGGSLATPTTPAASAVTPPTPPPVAPPPVTPPTPPTPPPAPATVDGSAPIQGAQYGVLSIASAPSDRPAAQHGDINLALRGFAPTQSTLGLIDMSGPTDNRAPQLNGLFADKRQPQVSSVYRAHNWDWGRNGRGDPLRDFEVTVVGLRTQAGETIHTPGAGYDIGDGYQVLVLYATPERLTLKYTREDNVVKGYTVHIDNVHAEPSLLALYDQMNAQGRGALPALRPGQALGRARGDEIAAIRDNGRFMDPRVRKDWWRG
ncbi:MAG: LysM peptidoglycan-binding domain-containing protein [Caldilineaceae bacterium]